MKPTDSMNITARSAHGPAKAGAAGGAASPADATLDAFAALLDGLCPDSAQPPALAGAAITEEPAAPANGRKAPSAPDAVLPDAFLLAVPPGLATPLAAVATTAVASSTPAASVRDAAGPDNGKGNAAAGWAAAAANDMHFAGTDAAPARPGAFQAILAASAAAPAEATRADAAPAMLAPDALGAALPLALAGAHAAPTLDAAVPSSPVHQAALAAHPQSPAFAADLGTELRWMVEAGVQQAELHLNPAELGPIQVQLTLNAQTAEIHFAAVHATTRESIQQALPVLREMLAGEGLQLGQAGVSGGDAGREFAQQQARAQEHDSRSTGGQPPSGAVAPRSASAAPRAGRGMLDLYA